MELTSTKNKKVQVRHLNQFLYLTSVKDG